MASIEKRGEYTYRIIVSNGYDRNNKKIVEKKTVTLDANLTIKQREKELQRLVIEFESKVKKGDVIDSANTFEKFSQGWLVKYAEKNLEETTIASYKGELETKILPAIGHIKLCDLKPLHLIRFYDNLTEDGIRIDGKPGGYSTRMIKYQHSIISKILQTAVEWLIINENITRRVQPPKGDDKPKGDNYLDDVSAEKFLSYVLDTEPLIYKTMAFLTTYGGLRKGEVLALNWSDVLFSENKVKVTKSFARANKKEFIKSPKNESSNRTIILPGIVMRLLKELKLSSTNTRVFPLAYAAPTQWFDRVRNRYNATHDDKLPETMTFHGLRHTSASLLISQGLDVETVASRLGHADTVTTLRVYSHAFESRDKATSDALENLFVFKSK